MILVGNGIVVTQDKNNPFINDGCVVIDENIIVDMGKTEEMQSRYSNYNFVDAKNKVIMPGLINTHHHIYSAFARGLNMDNPPAKSFTDILKNVWWKIDKTLSLEDVKYSGYTTLIECIKNGVTTVFDHHASPMCAKGSLFTLAKVAEELGIRGCFCYEVSDRDGDKIFLDGLSENIDFIKYVNEKNDDMIKGMFGMHASFTLSDKSLEKCIKAMEGTNSGYHIHVSEGIEDLHHSLKYSGKRVVERLMDFGILGEKTIAVHNIHVNNRELQLLEDTNTNVVNAPESNMGNAVGCAPVIKMMEKNIRVGLGTDGYTSDMFESMKVCNIIQKHNLCDSNVGWLETPKMIFDNNRFIAEKYFNKSLGILKKGAYGDVIIVNYNPLTPIDETNYNSHILFGISGRDVDTTIINGKIVMKSKEILTLDENKIFKESREVAKKLWDRI